MTGPQPCHDCGGHGVVGDREVECLTCRGPLVCAVCSELAVPPVCDERAVWWLGAGATVYCSAECLTADAEDQASQGSDIPHEYQEC